MENDNSKRIICYFAGKDKISGEVFYFGGSWGNIHTPSGLGRLLKIDRQKFPDACFRNSMVFDDSFLPRVRDYYFRFDFRLLSELEEKELLIALNDKTKASARDFFF